MYDACQMICYRSYEVLVDGKRDFSIDESWLQFNHSTRIQTPNSHLGSEPSKPAREHSHKYDYKGLTNA